MTSACYAKLKHIIKVLLLVSGCCVVAWLSTFWPSKSTPPGCNPVLYMFLDSDNMTWRHLWKRNHQESHTFDQTNETSNQQPQATTRIKAPCKAKLGMSNKTNRSPRTQPCSWTLQEVFLESPLQNRKQKGYWYNQTPSILSQLTRNHPRIC